MSGSADNFVPGGKVTTASDAVRVMLALPLRDVLAAIFEPLGPESRPGSVSDYLSYAECGVAGSTLRRWERGGRIHPVKVGREKRVLRTELDAAIRSCTSAPKTTPKNDASTEYLRLVGGAG